MLFYQNLTEETVRVKQTNPQGFTATELSPRLQVPERLPGHTEHLLEVIVAQVVLERRLPYPELRYITYLLPCVEKCAELWRLGSLLDQPHGHLVRRSILGTNEGNRASLTRKAD
uniref:Uncharacterized protein n=1 Tax=Steinernema glaseri TaxID=37863 RepID=A0A1I7ZIC1_9BILA